VVTPIPLVVFGGTGYAGSRIAAEAVHRGYEVTVVARNTPPDGASGTTFRGGSFYDADFRGPLLAAADAAVISVRSHNPEGPGLADAIAAVLAEAAQHGTRVGVVGGAGSLSTTPGGPSLIEQANIPDPTEPRAAEGFGHATVLDIMRRDTSGADWFYLSPPIGFGSYMPGEATGRYRMGGDVLLLDADGESAISGDDYALAFLDEIDTPRHRQTRFTVAH